jgi:hypothetical protein
MKTPCSIHFSLVSHENVLVRTYNVLVKTFSRGTLDPNYVTGFLDAAGSFTFSRTGRQIALYFAVRIAERDLALLEALQEFFGGIGRIYPGRSSYFRVTRRDQLVRIVEHFDRYPLHSTKQEAFETWREMVHAKQEFRRPERARLDALTERLRRR